MKTNQIIKKYGLMNPEQEVDTKGIISDLGQEFEARVIQASTLCQNQKIKFEYIRFLHLAKELRHKFDQISYKKAGPPLDDTIYSKIFAIYIIPLREKLFPVEHQKAIDKRESLRK